MFISYELVVETYKEAENTYKEAENTRLYDWWDCNAYVIDKLVPENERTDKPSFYHTVYCITDWSREYVISTYDEKKK